MAMMVNFPGKVEQFVPSSDSLGYSVYPKMDSDIIRDASIMCLVSDNPTDANALSRVE